MYSNDRLVRSGKESKFTDKDLEENTPVEYDVNIYKKGKKIDVIRVDTKTLANKKLKLMHSNEEDNVVTPLNNEDYIDSTIINNSINLKLRGNVKDHFSGKIELYKDDKLISSDASNGFQDSEIEEINSELSKRGQIINFADFKSYYYRPYEYIKVIKIPEKNKMNTSGYTPSINYRAGIVVYKNGRITVSGSRDQAPSHEMYAYIPYTDISITLFKASNKGFEYLFPVAPSARMSINTKI